MFSRLITYCITLHTDRSRFYTHQLFPFFFLFFISSRQQIKPERVQQPDGTYIEDYWRSSLRMLSDARFLDSLLNFDKDNIPDHVIDRIRKQYLTNPDFDPEKIKKVSTACEGLCRWVFAMSEYDIVTKMVAPKRKALEQAQSVYDKAMGTLREKQKQLRQVQVCRNSHSNV